MTPGESFHSKLAAGKIDAENIADRIMEGEISLESVLDGISNKLPRVQFGCSKSLLLLSGKNPAALYKKIDRVIELLSNENQILKWNAIAMLGNMAAVDRKCRIEGLLPMFYGFLSSGELIAANHAMDALGKIGRTFPEERKQIALHLCGVERESFDTDECRNIAIGKAIQALEMFADFINPAKSLIEFARRQTGNRRPATAKKAKALLGKLENPKSKSQKSR